MPIAKNTSLSAIPSAIAGSVVTYNLTTQAAAYNVRYHEYIQARMVGLASNLGSLSAWVSSGSAAQEIWLLLDAFGVNRQASRLVSVADLDLTLKLINCVTLNWIVGIDLPLYAPPAAINNPVTGASLAVELEQIYMLLARPGAVSQSGGVVVASKTAHCLFPGLAPMIDRRHTGLSCYHIDRSTYLAPSVAQGSWDLWVGARFRGVVNPSPTGAGAASWGGHQFLAAVGINQKIYELWQAANGFPGLPAFLALDPTPGTTGILRVLDKALW